MQMLNDILSKVILEKWSPKNKEKHAACKAKVKARSKVWPSAYASGQVVQCYYKEETEMENLRKLYEREMTSSEMASEKKLHKKIPKEPFIKQYGKEKGENVYYATTKKMAMENTGIVNAYGLFLTSTLMNSFLDKGLGHRRHIFDASIDPHRCIDAVCQ